jgi:anti-sigma factor RsiW
MGCKRFKNDLVDAALEELSPSRSERFRAHLAGCEACREALEEQRRLAQAIDRSLAESLACEPSPEFAARVRQRIAQPDAAARGWWSTWKLAAVGALAALALLAAWVLRPHVEAPVRVAKATPGTHTVSPRGNAPANLPARQSGKPVPPAGAGHAQHPSGQLLVAGNTMPEVLVPAEEGLAVRGFIEQLRQKRIDGAVLAAARPAATEELKVESLRVESLDAAMKPLGGKSNR